MPHSYQPNCVHKTVAAHTPTRAEQGLPDAGFVFCCFNQSYKVTPTVFALWLRLLKAVEGSVLWLLMDTPEVVQQLHQAAALQGIAVQRIVFAPRAALPEHLARLALADLFLDTVPVNAHTTASDALWAGLPVLTCSGQSLVSRVAGSLLHAVGLHELVTQSLQDYEALALGLARSPERLQTLRKRLADTRFTQPLFNPTLFASHLEKAYAAMAQRARQGLVPQAFDVADLG